MVKTFLTDNGFSDRATAANTFIRDESKDVKPIGKLHAHVKVEFTDASLNTFKIHATVRLQEDAELLGQTSDNAAVGRAIWIYGNKTYRSPQDLKFWTKKGEVTPQELKSYCRALADDVIKWESEIERQGCEQQDIDMTMDARKIALIGVGV